MAREEWESLSGKHNNMGFNSIGIDESALGVTMEMKEERFPNIQILRRGKQFI